MKRLSSDRLALAVGLPLVAGLTLLSGVIHGRMSNRWGPPRDVLPVAEKLRQLPEEFGAWRMHSEDAVSDTILATLECIGYVHRTYIDQDTGEAVQMVVFMGPPGPISVHTPEVCFPSRAYAVRQKPARESVRNGEGSENVFWGITFESSGLQAETLRVYYGWSAGGAWSAPDEARFAFAGRPYLYKIQLASARPGQADFGPNDPCRKFLEDFVPVAKHYLVEPAND